MSVLGYGPHGRPASCRPMQCRRTGKTPHACVLRNRAAKRPPWHEGTQGMFDSATTRRMMVDGQVRTADVHNPDLLAAMLTIPRERFVPSSLAGQAYLDSDIEIAPGRVLLKPMVFAKLIEAADVRATDHVLDVGCGFGYSSAVLSRLAASVVALEDDPALTTQAKTTLAAAGVSGVTVSTGPLVAGWPAAAPYDLILLNGATEI